MSDLSDVDKSVERLLAPASTPDQFSACPGPSTKSPQVKLDKTKVIQSILEAIQKLTKVNELKKNKAQALDRPKCKLADISLNGIPPNCPALVPVMLTVRVR